MSQNAPAATKRRRREPGDGASPADGPAVELPRPDDLIAEKYRIERLIGRGGMGAVYEASHVISGKRVAVKWMLPELQRADLVERFLHEARATARIDHPNVVDIYDVGLKDGAVFLVMELLHGESLGTRLERERLEPDAAVALLMPAMRGVAAAHGQGVIHRDLKPDNIFLCTGPEGDARDCKVLDFGISKVAAGDQRDLGMTRSGIVMGTPYYMSPEQIRALNQVDQRGDVYAFGVILYEMLARAYPYEADNYNALIVKIATREPTSLLEVRPDLDRRLASIVMRAVARDREQRYQSVAELALALEPFAPGVPFRTRGSVFEPPSKPRGRVGASRSRSLKMLAFALLVASALGGTAALMMPRAPSPVHPAQRPRATQRPQPEATAAPPVPSAVDAAARAAVPAQPESKPDTATHGARPGRKSPTPPRPRSAARRGATPARPGLPTETAAGLAADWDERLPTHPPPGPDVAPTPRGEALNSGAGALRPDDL